MFATLMEMYFFWVGLSVGFLVGAYFCFRLVENNLQKLENEVNEIRKLVIDNG